MPTSDPIVQMRAHCTFCERFPDGLLEVPDGGRPILRVLGRHYVCMIETNGEVMKPGSKASILIKAIDDGGLSTALDRTEVLELLDGPHVIATCHLISAEVLPASPFLIK